MSDTWKERDHKEMAKRRKNTFLRAKQNPGLLRSINSEEGGAHIHSS